MAGSDADVAAAHPGDVVADGVAELWAGAGDGRGLAGAVAVAVLMAVLLAVGRRRPLAAVGIRRRRRSLAARSPERPVVISSTTWLVVTSLAVDLGDHLAEVEHGDVVGDLRRRR